MILFTLTQVLQHILAFMLMTELDNDIGTECFSDRFPDTFGTIDDYQETILIVKSTFNQFG